jgi:hypothetical protein
MSKILEKKNGLGENNEYGVRRILEHQERNFSLSCLCLLMDRKTISYIESLILRLCFSLIFTFYPARLPSLQTTFIIPTLKHNSRSWRSFILSSRLIPQNYHLIHPTPTHLHVNASKHLFISISGLLINIFPVKELPAQYFWKLKSLVPRFGRFGCLSFARLPKVS